MYKTIVLRRNLV